MHTAVKYTGEIYTVKALVTAQGKCYFKKFYDNLEKAEKAKTLALIKFFANRKRVVNKEKFNYLRTTPPKQISRAKNCRERFLESKGG